MPDAGADRNLLLGILAVQMDFVSADQLIRAMNAWVLDKSKPLDVHLGESGVLAAETRALLSALVDKHVEQHGGDAQQSLAALSSAESLRVELAEVQDFDVQASLQRVPAAGPPQDIYATVMATPEAADSTLRYRVVRPHAMGGLGKVSVARDAELNREVALKELQDRHADDLDSRARFMQEAEITGGLEHPGIVPIYGLGHYGDGRPFYAMRFIRGDSLREAIERFHGEGKQRWNDPEHVFQLRRLLARLIDVCNAIEYAHSRGVLHRDLKPGNIMLGQYGETLVVDWGLAKAVGRAELETIAGPSDATPPMNPEATLRPSSGSGSAPTQMGSALGTPAFMSPEQALGRLDKLGPTSDVYSLGATLYMLLTGRQPQEEKDLGILLQRVSQGEFPSPRKWVPAMPRALEAVCLRAMALKPEERYQSPRAMAEDLEHWLADEPVSALPESWFGHVRRWAKAHRAAVIGTIATTAVALVSLVAGVLLLASSNTRERAAKEQALAAETEAQQQSERAETLFALARSSLEHYEELSKSEQLLRYGMESLRSDLLETAVSYYAALSTLGGQSPAERKDRGDAYFRLAGTYAQMSQTERALQAYFKSLEILIALESETSGDAQLKLTIAQLQISLGELLSVNQRGDEAQQLIADAQQRFRQLITSDENEASYRVGLSYSYNVEGERLRRIGQMDQAMATIQKTIDLTEQLIQQDPASQDYRFRKARALMQLGVLQFDVKWQFQAASVTYEEAYRLMTKLYEELPDYGDVGYSLVQILRNRGNLAARQNLVGEARRLYQEAIEILQRVELYYPEAPSYRREMADLLHCLGTIEAENQAREQGKEHLLQALAIGKKLVDQHPDQTDFRFNLAQIEGSLGQLLTLMGEEEAARQHWENSLSQLGALSEKGVGTIDSLISLAQFESELAMQMVGTDQSDEKLELLEKAEAHFNQLIELSPQFGNAHLGLAKLYLDRSVCLADRGEIVFSLRELDRVAAKSKALSGVSDALWMNSTFKALVVGAQVARWGNLRDYRNGGMATLLEEGAYAVVAEQVILLPEATGETADHYLAARGLAMAAAAAGEDESLDADRRREIVETYAAQAVGQLREAWQAGYIVRSGGFATLFSPKPTLRTLREIEEFAILRERQDFADLIEAIASSGEPNQPKEEIAGEDAR